MVEIPSNEVSQADLEEWYKLKQQLRALQASEILLRKKIFAGKFPDPVEGTNTSPLAGGWVLKGTYVLDRTIDIGALKAYGDRFKEANISVDELVQYKPSLVVKEYRTLTEEQRVLFDNCLVIKPGSPQLDIVLPAKNKKETDNAG